MNQKERFYDEKGYKREESLMTLKKNTEIKIGDRVHVFFTNFRYVIDDEGDIGLDNGLFATRVIDECPVPIGWLAFIDSLENPSVSYPGTTWQRKENCFIWGGTTPGATGGSKKISINQLPAHNHTASQEAHVHTQPPHVHKYSKFSYGSSGTTLTNGSFNWGDKSTDSTSAGGENTGTAAPVITVSNTGNGQDYMPPYYEVCVWKRIS